MNRFLGIPILVAGAACATPSSPPPKSPASQPAASGENVVSSADGVPIYYDVSGQGSPALVFIHFWTGDRNMWDAQVAHFAPTHRVVRIDLAGHGESGKERKQHSIEAFGADVAAVVNALGLEKVVLIGHSIGGPVALEADELLGDRVAGIVAVDAFFVGGGELPQGEEATPIIDGFLKPFEEDYGSSADGFMRKMFGSNADPAVIDRIATQAARMDPENAIGAMRALLVWAANEEKAALARAAERLRHINAERPEEPPPEFVRVVSGAGHFIPQEKPSEFNRTLEQILSGF